MSGGRSHANFLWLNQENDYSGQDVVNISSADNMINLTPDPITQTGTVGLNYITSDLTDVDILGGTAGTNKVRLPLLEINKSLLALKTSSPQFLAVDSINNTVGYATPGTATTSTWAQVLANGNSTGETSEVHFEGITTVIYGNGELIAPKTAVHFPYVSNFIASTAFGSNPNSGRVYWQCVATPSPDSAELQLNVDFLTNDATLGLIPRISLTPCIRQGTHLDYWEVVPGSSNSAGFSIFLRQFSKFLQTDNGFVDYHIDWVQPQDLSAVSKQMLTVSGMPGGNGTFAMLNHTYQVDAGTGLVEDNFTRLVYYRQDSLDFYFVIYDDTFGWRLKSWNMANKNLMGVGLDTARELNDWAFSATSDIGDNGYIRPGATEISYP